MLQNKNIKTFYDEIPLSRYKNHYEFERWFSSVRLYFDYYMLHKSVRYHLRNIAFQNCLEFGPGPGTWTKLLYKRNPKAAFTLIDISQSMKDQFLQEMRGVAGVSYYVADIMEYAFDSRFDFFFSSRALEYLEDKDAFLGKLSTILEDHAKGIIITKNPLRVGRKDRRAHHSGQITLTETGRLLKKHGFKDILAYPAIIRIPYLNNKILPGLAANIHHKLFRFPIQRHWLLRLTESYVIIFSK